MLLENLPPGQDIFYRVRFADLSSPAIAGEPVTGRFRTAPSDRRSVSFVWSGDTAGQGWGIDDARGGMRTYAAMQGNRPDFFIHSGDTHLCRRAVAARGEAAGRHALEQSRHRGEVEARRDARRVSRQFQIQPARPESCVRSTPRSRCSRNGTITRSATTGGPTRISPAQSTAACAIARRTRAC